MRGVARVTRANGLVHQRNCGRALRSPGPRSGDRSHGFCRGLTLVTAALLLASFGVGAETYRVDNLAGSDANDGLAAPLRSIAAAVKRLGPGDTLLLVRTPQPYRESIALTRGGTPGAPVVVDGAGATICGADPAPRQGWETVGAAYRVAQATEVKFLFGPDCRYEAGAKPAALRPREWLWQDGWLYFCPEGGKTPADYDLQMSVRVSGVMTAGAGQIIVRNLTAEHFYNDGFNLHNGSAPLWFENIRGLWNGDEGFSAHENCECYVRGAEFSHNYWHGIADVGIARTHYQNVVCRDNRSKGIWFIGALHSLTDCEISGSPIQVALSPSDLSVYPRADLLPLKSSVTVLRNVLVRSEGAQVGVAVYAGASGQLEHCVLRGGATCLQVAENGTAYVINSILWGDGAAEVRSAGTYLADANLYYPGRLVIGGKAYSPEEFALYVTETKNDRNSLVEEPRFAAGTGASSIASGATGAAFNLYGFGGPDIGLELRVPRPPEPGVRPALPSAFALAAAGGAIVAGSDAGFVVRYDFEEKNPWSRVYPTPEKSAAGVPIVGTAVLSEEQAHGGRRSAKLAITLPAGAPATHNTRLFSEKLPFARPVRAWRFWLYGDGSGRTLVIRVRDSGGECFYRAPTRLDWTGWRQVSWDLVKEPPANILGGNGNRLQDGPPLELVVEVAGEAGTQCVLYFDDLEVELE